MPAYIAVMGLAAALGLAKLVLLSYFLPAEGFGYYATVAGISAVMTAVLSFGRIEATIKSFPRAWVDKRPDVLVGQSKSIARTISIGALPIAILCPALAAYLFGANGFVIAFLSILLGYTSVLTRAVSALNLSTGETRLIQNFSFFRSAMTVVIAVGGALAWGWQGAIAGEVVSAAATILFGLLAIRKHMPFDAPRMPDPADRHLYASSLLTNASLMGDRPVVALLAGPKVAAVYAFTMLIAQMGQVFVNIIGQKMGPTIIQQLRSRDGLGTAVKYMAGGFAATAAVVGGVFVAALVAIEVPIGADLFNKYGVGVPLIAAACLVGTSYYYVVLEYAVVARDREGVVLTASAAAAVTFLAAAGISFVGGAGVAGYIAAMAAARFIQLAILGIGLADART